jgi:hypothetical protein
MATLRLPLAGTNTSRNNEPTKDQKFTNCYPETVENKETEQKRYFIKKRPGLRPKKALGADTLSIFYWEANNLTYYVTVDGGLFAIDIDDVGTPIEVIADGTLNMTYNKFGFASMSLDADKL